MTFWVNGECAEANGLTTVAELAKHYGLHYVGYYLMFAAGLTMIGLLGLRETKDDDLMRAA